MAQRHVLPMVASIAEKHNFRAQISLFVFCKKIYIYIRKSIVKKKEKKRKSNFYFRPSSFIQKGNIWAPKTRFFRTRTSAREAFGSDTRCITNGPSRSHRYVMLVGYSPLLRWFVRLQRWARFSRNTWLRHVMHLRLVANDIIIAAQPKHDGLLMSGGDNVAIL